MTKREARRLALLVIAGEIETSLDVSDDWLDHPETNERMSGADVVKVKDEGRAIVRALVNRAYR